MSSKNYFYLAKVSLAYNKKEELRTSLLYELPPSLPSPPSIYFYEHHTYVPYRIKSWQVKGKNIFFTLVHPHLLCREKEKGYDLFLSWEWLRPQLQKNLSLDKLVFCTDFTVFDEKNHLLGHVAGIQERKIQPLLIIYKEGEEIQIPVHEKFIEKIDFNEQRVHVRDAYS